MSGKQLEVLIRKMYEKAFNSGNLDLLDKYYDSNLVCHRPPYPVIMDLLAFKEWIKGFHNAFPDVKYTIHNVIVQGDTVAAQVTYSGTHTGILGKDIEPTGKHVSGPGCIVWHWRDDKIVEEWEYWDELGFWQQLGFTLSAPQQQ